MPENEKENSHHRGDSGIEKATAELFTEQGANVVISDIQEDEGRGTSGNIINTTDHA